MKPLDAKDVRAHLDRIVASRVFAESERMRRFLRFTVESKLSGQHDRVKEYIVGREVFDRTDGYDPRLDPIVRVEARRLRSKLDEYYKGPGVADAIRVQYPKGGYLPTFTRVQPAQFDWAPLKSRVFRICALLVVIACVATVAYRLARPAAPDVVAVIPATWLEAGAADLDPADSGVAEAVTADLANRHVARVLSWPVVQRLHGQFTSFSEAAARLGVSKLLLISIRNESSAKIVAAYLVDPKTGEKRHASRFFASAVGTLSEQNELARKIAGEYGR